MKRTIFTLLMGLMIGLVSAQVEPTNTVAVKDTTFRQDARLNYMITTILPAVQKFMSEEIAKQKVAGEVTYEQETIEMYQGLQGVVLSYAQNFVQINEVMVDPEKIVTEFTVLNARIDTLQSDPDIRHIEFLQEFKIIRERQEKLANYYQQIESAKPKYPEWVQPVGAHDAYNIPNKVLWNGKVYETTINANVWAPNVTGWKEIIE